MDTDAIKAITDEIANHKRRRHELEQPLQTAKKEFEQYASQVAEVKSELVSAQSLSKSLISGYGEGGSEHVAETSQ